MIFDYLFPECTSHKPLVRNFFATRKPNASINIRNMYNLSRVHQMSIPSVWNQIKFETFPANWMVISNQSTDKPQELDVVQYGSGGFPQAFEYLRWDNIAYLAFRVSAMGLPFGISPDVIMPVFVALFWIGDHASDAEKKLALDNVALMEQYFEGTTFVLLARPTRQASESTSQDNAFTEEEKLFVKRSIEMQIETEMRERYGKSVPLYLENPFATKECTHYDAVDEDIPDICAPLSVNPLTVPMELDDDDDDYELEEKDNIVDHPQVEVCTSNQPISPILPHTISQLGSPRSMSPTKKVILDDDLKDTISKFKEQTEKLQGKLKSDKDRLRNKIKSRIQAKSSA